MEALLTSGLEAPEPFRTKSPKDSEHFLPVQDRTVPEAALIVAAAGGTPRLLDLEEARTWLVTGRNANLTFTDLGKGWSSLVNLELKNGLTEDNFWHQVDVLDVRHRTNPLDDITDPLETYHREYPGNLVPQKERKFPATAIYMAAQGYKQVRSPERGKNVRKTLGNTATVVHTVKGYGWGVSGGGKVGRAGGRLLSNGD